MAITSVTIGGLDVSDGTSYIYGDDLVGQLYAVTPMETVAVDRARQTPLYGRSQPQARSISMTVFFLQTDAADRKADFDSLVAAVANPVGSSLISLRWTDAAVTYEYLVHRQTLIPDRWFAKATLDLTSYDRVAAVV